MNRTRNRRRTVLAAAAIAAAGVLGACSGGSNNPTGTTANAAAQTPATGQVLPVSSNPITNNATADGLSIKSVLVENKFGVLARVTSLISRRGYNITSLAVAPARGTTTRFRPKMPVPMPSHSGCCVSWS